MHKMHAFARIAQKNAQKAHFTPARKAHFYKMRFYKISSANFIKMQKIAKFAIFCNFCKLQKLQILQFFKKIVKF